MCAPGHYDGAVARSWAAYILPVALVASGVAYYLRTERAPSAPAAPTPSASSSSEARFGILDGLRVGDTIEDWTVGKIFLLPASDSPQLAVEIDRRGSGITVWVSRKGAVDKPPVVTARHALTFGDARPYGEPIPEGALEQLTNKIAERVRRAERDPANDL